MAKQTKAVALSAFTLMLVGVGGAAHAGQLSESSVPETLTSAISYDDLAFEKGLANVAADAAHGDHDHNWLGGDHDHKAAVATSLSILTKADTFNV